MFQLRSATGIIAIVTVAVSAIAILAGLDYSTLFAGFIPARLSGIADLPGALPAWITPLSSALVHGGWLHLAINMVMLVFAGTMVERIVGGAGLAFAYIIGAIVAALAQFLVDPASPVPMVGASGAISALFGLYAVYFGRPKQVTRNMRLNRWIHVAWLLATWVVLQWMTGLLAGGQGVMLATPAHIGGFIAGLLLQRPLLLWKYRKA
ncbi:rhomboid family intramembrane serine protease [Sphingomonas sp.]|uniref:rhomboid family intramembrane serine protease n=1 Tax=Sphingomonas sp. TaxID=28214 RepID=UPI002EDA8D75